MKDIFRFTQHFRERYAKRILNEDNQFLVKDLDRKILSDLKYAVKNNTYLNLPRFVLHLHEHYNGINGLNIFETESVIYITRKEKDMGFYKVLTCWSKKEDTFFGPNGMYRNSALPLKEIYTRIAEAKARNNFKRR